MGDLEANDLDILSVSSSLVDRILVDQGLLSPDKDDKSGSSSSEGGSEKVSSVEGGGQAIGKIEEPRTPPSSVDIGGKMIGSVDVSPLRMGSPWEEKGKWEVVNRLLRMEGYRPLDLEGGEVPNTSDVIKVFIQVLGEHRDRGELIKTVALDNNRVDQDQRTAEGKLSVMDKERSSLVDSVMSAASRVKELEEELEDVKKQSGHQLRDLKTKTQSLTQQLRQSEHRVKSKESQINKIATRLETMISRENEVKEKEKSVFKKMHRRDPRANDTKTLEVIGLYESNRKRMTEEMEALKEEIRYLNETLRDKENYIMQKEKNPGDWKDGRRGGVGLEETLQKYKELERSARLSKQREEGLLSKLKTTDEELEGLKEKVERLEEDNTNLILELKSRPTVRSWKGSQKRIEELELKLQRAVDDAREASDLRELRKHMGVGELVRRDKLNYKLKLHNIDAVPREVMKEILKELCRITEVTDVATLATEIEKMNKVLKSLPRLERFVREICGFVFRREKGGYDEEGKPLTSDDIIRRQPMEEVLPILKSWCNELQGLSVLREFRRSVLRRLSVKFENLNELSDERILDSISDLVETERMILKSRAIHEKAELFLVDKPELFVNRVVQHFQYLFQVKKVEGVLPKMNELYLYTSEMENMIKVLKSLVGIEGTCSNTVLLATLQAAIERDEPVSISEKFKRHMAGGDEESDEN